MTVIDDAVIRSSGAHLLALFADFCEHSALFLARSIKGTGGCKEMLAPLYDSVQLCSFACDVYSSNLWDKAGHTL